MFTRDVIPEAFETRQLQFALMFLSQGPEMKEAFQRDGDLRERTSVHVGDSLLKQWRNLEEREESDVFKVSRERDEARSICLRNTGEHPESSDINVRVESLSLSTQTFISTTGTFRESQTAYGG